MTNKKPNKYLSFDEHLKEELKDPEFKMGYDIECIKLDLAIRIHRIRKARRISVA